MKTIEKLLAEGRALLAEQERERRERAQIEERDRREAWGLLCQAAFRELGELAEELDPTTPPEDFSHLRSYDLLLSPFGVPCLRARFASGRDSLWYPVSYMDHRRELYRVETRWAIRWDDEGDEGWYVFPDRCEDTSSLPTAILFACTSSQEYKRLAEEAKIKPAPVHAQSRQEKRPLPLSDAEERLILALREITEQAREE